MEDGKAQRTSDRKEDEKVILPGFRFHPTDEELVWFYLRRKVEDKPISIEFIKQIDIYKYDPWDLPKSSVGEKEKYFFCKRGRKYKNSTRPNRGTGSGFWKATGIDRPVASTRELHGCIGLKKSLVYYIGSAGKGSKTNWMMHEFRLPPHPQTSDLSPPHLVSQEAEVWTLCRIFKRISNHKKYPSSLKKTSSSQSHPNPNPNPNPNPDDSGSSKSNSFDSESSDSHLGFHSLSREENTKTHEQVRERNSIIAQTHESSSHEASSSADNLQRFWNSNQEDFFSNAGWDELSPVVGLAFEPSTRFI